MTAVTEQTGGSAVSGALPPLDRDGVDVKPCRRLERRHGAESLGRSTHGRTTSCD